MWRHLALVKKCVIYLTKIHGMKNLDQDLGDSYDNDTERHLSSTRSTKNDATVAILSKIN